MNDCEISDGSRPADSNAGMSLGNNEAVEPLDDHTLSFSLVKAVWP